MTDIRAFEVAIPQSDLDDLAERLAKTRWPDDLAGAGWSRGVPVDYLKRVAEYWRTSFDWRAQERRLNQFPQFTTEVDGQTIHFVHARSPHPDAMPLLLIHGWPGSFVEFLAMVDGLTNPEDPAQAFHVVAVSIPGHGFSMPLSGPGWTHARCARAYAELMGRLGYSRYGVQGGDHGAFQAPAVGRADAEHVVGVHVNALLTFPSGDAGELDELTTAERERLERLQSFDQSYIAIQQARPQTLSYGLTDSPVGQLAWIIERFKEWTDPANALPEDAVDLDDILTDVSLYWLTRTAGTSAQLYYETGRDASAWNTPRGTVPTGVAVFTPHDIAIRRLAERDHNVVHWSEFDRGGHFAAMEVPDLLMQDVREFFGRFR